MTGSSDSDGGREIRILGYRLDPHRVIYGTVILMVTLTAVGDVDISVVPGRGIAELVTITFFPLLALALAHGFSDALDLQIRTGKRMTPQARRLLVRESLQYLTVGVPFLVLVLALAQLGVGAGSSVDLGVAIYALSLVVWGVIAARSARLGPLGQVRYGTVYGILGFGIVLVELAVLH